MTNRAMLFGYSVVNSVSRRHGERSVYACLHRHWRDSVQASAVDQRENQKLGDTTTRTPEPPRGDWHGWEGFLGIL